MIRLKKPRNSPPDISMAPLVDCVFLLLIFFLLTSTFSEKQAIKIELPKSSTATPHKEKIIEIELSNDGRIRLRGKPVELHELSERLKVEVDKIGKQPIFLVADGRVPLDRIVEIIDCVREAKLETISIATKRKEISTEISSPEERGE